MIQRYEYKRGLIVRNTFILWGNRQSHLEARQKSILSESLCTQPKKANVLANVHVRCRKFYIISYTLTSYCTGVIFSFSCCVVFEGWWVG